MHIINKNVYPGPLLDWCELWFFRAHATRTLLIKFFLRGSLDIEAIMASNAVKQFYKHRVSTGFYFYSRNVSPQDVILHIWVYTILSIKNPAVNGSVAQCCLLLPA